MVVSRRSLDIVFNQKMNWNRAWHAIYGCCKGLPVGNKFYYSIQWIGPWKYDKFFNTIFFSQSSEKNINLFKTGSFPQKYWSNGPNQYKSSWSSKVFYITGLNVPHEFWCIFVVFYFSHHITRHLICTIKCHTIIIKLMFFSSPKTQKLKKNVNKTLQNPPKTHCIAFVLYFMTVDLGRLQMVCI